MYFSRFCGFSSKLVNFFFGGDRNYILVGHPEGSQPKSNFVCLSVCVCVCVLQEFVTDKNDQNCQLFMGFMIFSSLLWFN